MKKFLITYTFRPETGSREDWHRHVREFIAGIDEDPELKGRIRYTCMKSANGDAYFHLAEPVDDAAVQALNQRDWFKRYTAETKRVGGGEVTVTPLEAIAQTKA